MRDTHLGAYSRRDVYMVTVFVVIVLGSTGMAIRDHGKWSACEDACSPVRAKMIDHQCHCATEIGWARP